MEAACAGERQNNRMVLYGVIGIGGQPLKKMGGDSMISEDVIKQLVILNLIQNLLNRSRSLQGDPGSSPG